MKKPNKQTKAKNDRTLVAFVLDRTGSMESVKQETISGFNGYLDELAKKPEAKGISFYMMQFDTQSFDTLHDCVPLGKVTRLSSETYVPRGGTPLYDAVGKTIRTIEEKANGHKVLFVTLTDGHENSSTEWTDKTVKALIKEKEQKDKWTFSYIGIGQEAWDAVAQLAHGTSGFSNVLRATRGRNTKRSYTMFADATMKVSHSIGGQCVQSLYDGAQLDKEDDAA